MQIARKLFIISVAVEPAELFGDVPTFAPKLMPEALAQLAIKQFKKLDTFNIHRQAIALYYEQALKNEKIGMLPPNEYGTSIFLRFPIFLPNPQGLIAYAKTQHIELGNWYSEPIAPAGVEYESILYTPCRTAEQLVSLSVNLPTSIQIQENDARKVVRVVKEYLLQLNSNQNAE
jgi:dTDP-4-amino-4,6-dideoxygalactose transaminase